MKRIFEWRFAGWYLMGLIVILGMAIPGKPSISSSVTVKVEKVGDYEYLLDAIAEGERKGFQVVSVTNVWDGSRSQSHFVVVYRKVEK